MKFDESSMSETLMSKNFDKLIEAFIGKVLTGKIERENFDESLTVHQNSSDFSTIKVLCSTVYVSISWLYINQHMYVDT